MSDKESKSKRVVNVSKRSAIAKHLLVITRARSSTALKMIGPQKCSVYLKFPYLGNISERFSKKISEK